jgi:HKD family nuclease
VLKIIVTGKSDLYLQKIKDEIKERPGIEVSIAFLRKMRYDWA